MPVRQRHRRRTPARARRVASRCLTGAIGLTLAATAAVAGAAASTASTASTARTAAGDPDSGSHLYLVVLDGPGTSADARPGLGRVTTALGMLARQQRVLDGVGAPAPLYRWTTALDGFAVDLSPAQARALAARPDVVDVERNHVRPTAGVLATAGAVAPDDLARLGVHGPRHGGRGQVIGVVDTGIAPASPLFAQLGSGRQTLREGACREAPDWPSSSCNGKVVVGRTFVAGFTGASPEAALGSTASESPLDTEGHGTQLASIAAGNSRTSIRIDGVRRGTYGGIAPDARIAAYKACWSAPDPRDDGCASADLVAAIDAATADGVDVLNLAVPGPDRIGRLDAIDRALLGSAESGAVVVTAAGNGGSRAYAAHAVPWALTVGATAGSPLTTRVSLHGGPTLTASTLSRAGIAPRRLVRSVDLASPGHSRAQARVCVPGSLDAARVRDRIVVCRDGVVDPTEKVRAAELAGAAAVILLDDGGRGAGPDAIGGPPAMRLHAAASKTLTRWLARHPRGRISVRPARTAHGPDRVASYSASGDPDAALLKPDVVAAGGPVLGAVPPPSGAAGAAGAAEPMDGWNVLTGTSASTAVVSGLAADLLARRGWTPERVRSALATTARPLLDPLLRSGAGAVDPAAAAHPGLALLVAPRDYRRWVDGELRRLDTPSILLARGRTSARREITNVTDRRLYFSSATEGFRGDVRVSPAAVVLGPGQSARFTVRAQASSGPVDDGYVVWRGAGGTTTRVPVVIAR